MFNRRRSRAGPWRLGGARMVYWCAGLRYRRIDRLPGASACGVVRHSGNLWPREPSRRRPSGPLVEPLRPFVGPLTRTVARPNGPACCAVVAGRRSARLTARRKYPCPDYLRHWRRAASRALRIGVAMPEGLNNRSTRRFGCRLFERPPRRLGKARAPPISQKPNPAPDFNRALTGGRSASEMRGRGMHRPWIEKAIRKRTTPTRWAARRMGSGGFLIPATEYSERAPPAAHFPRIPGRALGRHRRRCCCPPSRPAADFHRRDRCRGRGRPGDAGHGGPAQPGLTRAVKTRSGFPFCRCRRASTANAADRPADCRARRFAGRRDVNGSVHAYQGRGRPPQQGAGFESIEKDLSLGARPSSGASVIIKAHWELARSPTMKLVL